MADIEKTIRSLFNHAAAGGMAVLIFKIIVALLFFLIASRIIEALCKHILKKLSARKKIDTGAAQFLNTLFKIGLYLVVILMILNLFGMKTSSLITILGSLGLAVVLGLKDNLSNVASGIIILCMRPFKVGDYILEADHQTEGTVVEIGLFFTKLKTLDERINIIPNMNLTATAVTNFTDQEFRTLDLHYELPYGSDLDRAKEIIRGVVWNDKETHKDRGSESVHVFVYELADSAVTLCSRSRVRTCEYWQTRYRLLENIYKAFEKEGISFAYPHMDVSIK